MKTKKSLKEMNENVLEAKMMQKISGGTNCLCTATVHCGNNGCHVGNDGTDDECGNGDSCQ